MTDQRQQLADALFASFGGLFYISRGRALKHGTFLAEAGFARPRFLTSAAEAEQLGEGAIVERMGEASEFFVKRNGLWNSIDGGDPIDDAALGAPTGSLAVRRG